MTIFSLLYGWNIFISLENDFGDKMTWTWNEKICMICINPLFNEIILVIIESCIAFVSKREIGGLGSKNTIIALARG